MATKANPETRATAASAPAPAVNPTLIEQLVAAEARKVFAELAKSAPRPVFDGDDALFLAWMAGFVAGAHSARPGDVHAAEIFARARTMVDKLAPIAQPPLGGS